MANRYHLPHSEISSSNIDETLAAVYNRLAIFEASVELSADEVFWMRPDSSICYVNKSACERLGYTRQELLGMHVWDWDPNITEEKWPAIWRVLQEQKIIKFESVHKDKAGKSFPVEISGYLIDIAGDELIFAFVNDISSRTEKDQQLADYQNHLERKVKKSIRHLKQEKQRAEDNLVKLNQSLALLEKREALLERMGQVAGIGGWELDLITNTLTWTSTTYDIHGLPADYQPSLDTAIEFYTPEARPVIQAAVEQAIAGKGGWDHELPLVRADGKTVWVRAVGDVELKDGKPIRLYGAFQDITESRNTKLALAQKHELLRVTLQSIGDGVITTDETGRITWLNPVAENMTGWSESDALGKEIEQVFNILHEKTRKPAISPVSICLHTQKTVGLAHSTILLHRDGQEFGIEDSAAPIFNDEGEMIGAVLVFHDVSEQRRLSNEMTYRATHDALTSLSNRDVFEKTLEHIVLQIKRTGGEHALLFIDLDQFKLVNDTCGHVVGDELLKQVSAMLAERVRGSDLLSRLGGDEFAVILYDCNIEKARLIGNQICTMLDEFRFSHAEHVFHIGASIGVVGIDNNWPDAASVLKAADAACYAAKDSGRNRVHIWQETDDVIVARHAAMNWAAKIEKAFEEDRFELYAQRIICVNPQHKKLHAEVLLRMQDDEQGLLSAGLFMSAAERYQLAGRIDRFVLQRVVASLTSMKSLEFLDVIAVNISGQSVGDRAFHHFVTHLLELLPDKVRRRLCLEITETSAISNFAEASLFVSSMRKLGVKIALDDFGAGASSFGYLKNLTVDYLKIDGQFVRDIISDPLDDVAVKCFVDVAKVMQIKTVAEFVDSEAVFSRLKVLGVDYIQGFLMHRPEPLNHVLIASLCDVQS